MYKGSECQTVSTTATINGYKQKWDSAVKQVKLAHRLAWEQAYGPIPDGSEIHHLCGNRLCSNVQHLEALSKSDHLKRHRKIRTHCKNGHELSPDNLIPNKAKLGLRACIVCSREQARKRRIRSPNGQYRSGWTHCQNGHPLTPDNLVASQLRVGQRRCLICHRAYHLARYHAKKNQAS